MEILRRFLNEYLVVSEEDWKAVSHRFKPGECEKNYTFTKEGEPETKLYFLESGAVRLYHESKTKDVTLNIGFPNNFISSYSSFLTQKPSGFILESLTACRYWVISKSDLQYLYENTQCGHELGRILTENIFLYLSERENAFLLKSPTERYLDLFDQQPKLIQEIPQKYLSSYIGITPQALSRIRAKLAQEL